MIESRGRPRHRTIVHQKASSVQNKIQNKIWPVSSIQLLQRCEDSWSSKYRGSWEIWGMVQGRRNTRNLLNRTERRWTVTIAAKLLL